MQTIDRLGEVMSELGLDRPNGATVGRLVLTGGVGYATEDDSGRMSGTLRIPAYAMGWEPSVLMLPHGGDLELELINDDPDNHCATLPCNGDKRWIWLPTRSRGTAALNLDGPGYYWFGSTIANNEGRGLIGVIVVQGEVPAEGRLDRPQQPRP